MTIQIWFDLERLSKNVSVYVIWQLVTFIEEQIRMYTMDGNYFSASVGQTESI